MNDKIYFDHAASTPVDPRVTEAMTGALGICGNPSATHSFGREARAAVDRARMSVAGLVGADASEMVFTSGATESNNTAILGIFAAAAARFPGRSLRVLVSPVEHASVNEPLKLLAERHGAVIDFLPVDQEGRVSADDVAARLTDDTVLVCVMWVNNVLGTVQPVEEIGAKVASARAARRPGVLPLYFFCDAAQAASWREIRVRRANIDALTVSAHKLYGPSGIGALYLRKGTHIQPLLRGGGQEDGRRSGTENLSGIVGLGAAADLAVREGPADAAHMGKIRRTFTDLISVIGRGYEVLGPSSDHAAPGIIYCRSTRHTGDILGLKLDESGFAVSSGSSCQAGSRQPSSVVQAVYGEKVARQGGIRVSFGRSSRPEDIRRLLDELGRL